jgi:formylglycine-generating enzyme required for sulfatase activity
VNGSGNDGDAMTINGIACVLVKAGTFTMGVDDYWNYTTHQVTLTKDFWISKNPITNAQFGKTVEGKSDHPVVNVNWAQADTWAKSKGGRLLTEAEWEFAARGGNKSQGYIYSGSNTIGDVAWYGGNSGGSTHPVGQKQANELGIYDMSGNVYEWCSDWYSSYSSSAVTNPTGPSTGDNRVYRGGSWNGVERYCRVAYRSNDYPSGSNYSLGFRVAFPRN